MIRKAIIVMLTLAAVALGTIGVLAGSVRTTCYQTLWSSGENGTTGYRHVGLFWGTSKQQVALEYTEVLDANAGESQTVSSGPGYTYYGGVHLSEDSGFYVRFLHLEVSFFIPILLAILFSIYAVILFVRGPLRRRRRRRRGLCLKCDYDLTGNTSGVCPECGSEVEQA